jgi:hypothetical protein
LISQMKWLLVQSSLHSLIFNIFSILGFIPRLGITLANAVLLVLCTLSSFISIYFQDTTLLNLPRLS